MSSKRPEDVFIHLLRSAYRSTRHGARQLTPLPASSCVSRAASRPLSSLAARGATLHPSIGQRGTYHRPDKLPRPRNRAFATAVASNGKPREIAVLGGGITGLITAHYLARHAKNANITLYDASSTLGGWVKGSMVRVGDGEDDQVLFQHGPRMLRTSGTSVKYDDLVFYDVVASLNLQDKLHAWDNTSDRYIYYPDHLVKTPSTKFSLTNVLTTLRSFLTEPLWDGAWRSGLNMMFTRPKPTGSFSEILARDVSVGEFMEKEMGSDPRLVDNLVSAMMHGIYGGDVRKLSAKCTMLESTVRDRRLPQQTDCSWVENKDKYLLYDMTESRNRRALIDIAERNIGKSIMVFEDGLLTLVDALVKDLEARDNVTIKTTSRVTSLAYKNDKVSVSTKKSTKQYDHVISTLFSKHLASLASPAASLPSLAATSAVTIMVVNLWFPNPSLLAPNPGFGYLVPSTTPDNDECVLGVLFDSDLAPPRAGEPPGIKLTVMMGGHHWDGWPALPSREMAQEMAVQAVRRHLRIAGDEPVVARATLCRDCLPQHHVGHRARMSAAHYELLAAFQGRLSVAGPSYTTVGVIPAMRAGFDVAMRVATGRGPPWYRDLPPGHDSEVDGDTGSPDEPPVDHVGATGLEGFTEDEARALRLVNRGDLSFRAWTNPDKRCTDGQGNWIRPLEHREWEAEEVKGDDEKR